MSELDQQLHCATKPILTSVLLGGAVEAYTVYRGVPFNPRTAALTAGVVYGYAHHVSTVLLTAAERTSRQDLAMPYSDWQ